MIYLLIRLISSVPIDIDSISTSRFPKGVLRNAGLGPAVAAIPYPEMDLGRLFHDQVILYGPDPFDAPCDFTRFIDGVLGINEAAQFDPALVGLDTDLE
jgi:hypothetical protein